MSRMSVSILVSAVLAACGNADAGSFAATVRDSAGIQIVETAGDLWAAPVRWTASAKPVVRIGAMEGDQDYLFSRVLSLAVLSDGRVVVANSGDHTIRWFGPDGRFLLKRGGTGKGPGEFSQMNQISRVAGDTIVASDWVNRRMTLFTPDGEPGPIIPITGMKAPPSKILRTSAGDWIVGSNAGFSTAQFAKPPAPGRYRPDVPVLRISHDGTQVDTIGEFPATEIEVVAVGRGVSYAPPRFGRDLYYAVVNDQVLVAPAERMQFDFYSLTGEHVRSVRAPDVDVRLTSEIAADYESYLRQRAEKASAERQAEVERTISEMKLPETMPAYAGVIVDDDGRAWVGAYRYDRSVPQQFLVFDTAGRFTGKAVVPSDLLVLAIQDGRVWGRTTDELGVEYVVAYALAEQ